MEDHFPLSELGAWPGGAGVDPAATFVLGWGPAGDVLVYTTDGRAGWLAHDPAGVRFRGSVLDTVDWVFGELLANRCPDLP